MCEPMCCFPASTLVLMADGTQKPIEQVVPGDWIQGPTGAWEVDHLYVTHLGQRRMFAMREQELLWSEEHPLWTRDNESGTQWWWSASPDKWQDEIVAGVTVGLFDNDSMRTGSGYQFAHLDDVWRSDDPCEQPGFNADTPLYLPIPVSGRGADRMCFLNGYLISASTNQFDYDYSKFQWSEALAQDVKERVQRLALMAA
ncbi:MAG: hypothetical protein DCC58_19870 [Chloroflexi bacterium]|nr:MAG: hypothetical protein DCC58_19870 [Chloroflexota bacterium]